MKKLFMGFVTAALLTVCLCVPAFAAAECDHSSGNHLFRCDKANYFYGTVYIEAICLDCGTVLESSEVSVSDADWLYADLYESEFLHSFVGGPDEYECIHMADLFSCELVLINGTHYFYCSDCSSYLSLDVRSGGLVAPHSETDCFGCEYLSSVFGEDFELCIPSTVLSSVTTLVTSSVDWLTAFALCILSTPLFLIFVCCIFVGLGIALIKRSIHL